MWLWMTGFGFKIGVESSNKQKGKVNKQKHKGKEGGKGQGKEGPGERKGQGRGRGGLDPRHADCGWMLCRTFLLEGRSPTTKSPIHLYHPPSPALPGVRPSGGAPTQWMPPHRCDGLLPQRHWHGPALPCTAFWVLHRGGACTHMSGPGSEGGTGGAGV